jgi:hypothetical protein
MGSLHEMPPTSSDWAARQPPETTKTRHERVVPYSAPTGALLSEYLQHRATLTRARAGLFLLESRRNHAEPITLW